jgi:magnesium transporter
MPSSTADNASMRLSAELLYLLHGDPAELQAAISGFRAADVAEGLRELTPEAGAKVMAALPFDLAVQVFDEPELAHERCGIVQHMPLDAAGALIDAMSSDQQADLFREIPTPERDKYLSLVDESTRRALKLLLGYSPESAGGIMTTEFVSVPTTRTVAETLEYLRQVAKTKETIYTVYCTEPGTNVLVHVVSLRDLMMADRDAVVLDVGNRRRPLTVTTDTDREDVARTISKYNLLAIPVVDEGGHMLGIVTVDDVIDALVREQTEDVQKFGGMEALDEPYTQIGFPSMIKKRAGWLCALFLSEMLTATAMQHFEGEISKAVVLAMFIPLVMSSGGNSGSQATSLIIRAIALREIRLRDWWKIAIRELPTGLTLGAILGIIGFTRIELWQQLHLFDYGPHHRLVALTVGLALVGIVGFGSLAGSMLPFLLKKLGFDPASASAPFVATLVDVTGLIIYFSVAFITLRGTLL